MNKAVFLDRDGVINDNTGYVNSVDDLKFIPGVFDFCRAAAAKGYKLIVVTNQGGIAAGHITEEAHDAIKKKILEKFQEESCALTDYFFCPHLSPDHPALSQEGLKKRDDLIIACRCRKPMPGMIYEAQDKHALTLYDSVLIGDREVDIDAALAAGVARTFLFNKRECVWPTI